MSLHIAILDADVPVPAVYAARGLYSSQFRHLLQSAAARLPKWKHVQIYTSAYDVVGGVYPALDMLKTAAATTATANTSADAASKPIDAILITGSAASAYYQGAEYQWIAHLQSFIRRVWTDYPAVKMFGSCFGHQIIAQALLATSSSSSSSNVRVEACPMGYEVGIHPITLNPAFAADTMLGRIFSEGLKKGKKRKDDGRLRIRLIHGDRVVGLDHPSPPFPPSHAVKKSGSGWLNIGSTQLSPTQGLYYPGRVLTYQGHFEFDEFVNTETVLEFGRRCGWAEQVLGEYLQLIACKDEDEDDSELAAEVVVRFLSESLDVDRPIDGIDGIVDCAL